MAHKQGVPWPAPPKVPKWTPELVWSRIKQRVKKQFLAVRGQACRFGVKPSGPPPDWKRCERILVLRTDRLGDTILTIPLIQALKLSAPSAEIIYAVRKPWVDLFDRQKNVDRVIGLPEDFSQQSALLSGAHPDLIIDPQTEPEMKSARLCQGSGAPWRIGFSGYGRESHFTSYLAPPEEPRHFSLEVLELLTLWNNAIKQPVIPPFLEIPKTAQPWWKARLKKVPDLSEGYVCIHPGGFYRTQRWPADRFYHLAARIQEELGRTVVWCSDTGPEAGDSHGPRPPKPGKIIVFSDLTLDQLAAVVGNARLFIGNNSGPLHLACALATSTVSMMGPTVPHRWWPVGQDHQILRLGVACSPCTLGRCSHHTCLRALDVDRVYEVVEASLSENAIPISPTSRYRS